MQQKGAPDAQERHDRQALKFRYFSLGAGAGSVRTSVSSSMGSPPETTFLQEAVSFT